MSPKRATNLVKEIIVDLDAALASNGREALDERHSALASAMMLCLRLFGGTAVNVARIASALEKRNELATPSRDADALDAMTAELTSVDESTSLTRDVRFSDGTAIRVSVSLIDGE